MAGDAGTGEGAVLFLPLSKGHVLEMLPIARALRAESRRRPLFALGRQQERLLPLIAADDLPAVRADGSAMSPDTDHDGMPHITSQPPPKQRVFSRLPSVLRAFILFRAERRRARRLFERHPDIRLLLVAGDRNIGIETAVIAEASRHRIPSIIVPFAISFPETAVEARHKREERERPGGFAAKYGARTLPRCVLRLFFPSWVRTFAYGPMFFQPPSAALAAWLLGMAPRDPWLIGGGAATRMAVESEALREALLVQGMRPGKMVVTGKPGLDDVARMLAGTDPGELRRSLGISEDKRVILCSVPELAENNFISWEEHEEQTRFLFQTLAATGAQVILSLHPKCDRAWYQPFADAAGARIADERIYRLLPACDLFVSNYSSTICQAIALGKPSISVDFVGQDFPFYDHAPGVIVVKEPERLLPLLQSLLSDRARYDSLAREQREQGQKWALLDGKSTKRVLVLAEELTTAIC